MASKAVFGIGIGIDGGEAAMQATQRALNQLGTTHPALGLVFVAQEYNIQEVLAGLTALLGETPLWGFSSLCPLTGAGDQPRSVVVALLAGKDFKAQVHWFPQYAQDSQATARQLFQRLEQAVFLPEQILLAVDGINGSLEPVCAALSDLPVQVMGGMASGEPAQGKTCTIGKNQAGTGALSAAILGEHLRMGVGLGHGWQDLGIYVRATHTRDVWVHALDQQPAAEVYAQYLGYSAREWAFPPLSDLARQYPLGIEPQRSKQTAPFVEADPRHLLIRSALRMEVDGSLRMSAPVPQGSLAHLMTGDPQACLRAAEQAAKHALAMLEDATPLLALALVDAAWQVLFEPHPGAFQAALQTALGDIPLVGAYTYGQLSRPDLEKPPVLQNQNIEVLVLGEVA